MESTFPTVMDNTNFRAPQTPITRNDSFDADMPSGEPGTGRKTRGSLASESPEEDLVTSPTQSFLAYARQRRSLTSPFHLNKARHLLTFADADTAQEWWTLMQSEYPESSRESPQLFSFKSDRIPGKAWKNPKLAHLRDKWSYRLIDDRDDKTADQHQNQIQQQSHRRVSFSRTPSMPTLREGSVVAGFESLEDPFTPIGASKVDFAQLNVNSDYIQKSMDQSTLQLDALLEGQQASAKGFQKLSATIERMTQEMEGLARRQQEHEIVLRELTAAATAHNAASDVQYRHQQAAALQSLQSIIEETCSRVEELYNRPPPVPESNDEILQKLQDEVLKTSTRMQELCDRPLPASDSHTDGLQKLHKDILQNTKALRTLSDRPVPASNVESLQKLQKELSENTANLRALMDRPVPVPVSNTELLQKLQKEMSSNTAAIQTLSDNQKVTKKHLQKLQVSLENTTLDQKALATQLKQTHALSETTHALTVRLASTQDLKFEHLEAKMERQAMQTRKMMAAQQEGFKSSMQEILEAVKAQQTLKAECGHDVMPPPRKVHRKLVGYVYEKE